MPTTQIYFLIKLLEDIIDNQKINQNLDGISVEYGKRINNNCKYNQIIFFFPTSPPLLGLGTYEVKGREGFANTAQDSLSAWPCHTKNKTQASPSNIYLQGREQCSHKNPSLSETHGPDAQLVSHHLQFLEKSINQLRIFEFKKIFSITYPL